ncbi:MAG TPA: enoyl-CoA hydratase-related protein [Anaerolineae bacterium]|nr:enoyl-CoA hydratase-related protein [Anaerolineae bacterium]
MADFIRYSIEERVATLVIDHPPVNALNGQTLRELNAALDELLANPEVKVIVITGGGHLVFVAGADIGEINAIVTAEDAVVQLEAASQAGQDLFNQIEQARKPVIAAINGVCLGGGLELALACHIRIAGDRARLGQPEINLGIIPGWGGTQRLARIVGPSKATELILTGDPITAQQAMQLRLVNLIVPGDQVIRQAKGLAAKIASKSAVAVSAALAAIGAGLDADLPAGLMQERKQFAQLAASEDVREGVGAFLEKRPPQFKDR